jgi:hypothetical protein
VRGLRGPEACAHVCATRVQVHRKQAPTGGGNSTESEQYAELAPHTAAWLTSESSTATRMFLLDSCDALRNCSCTRCMNEALVSCNAASSNPEWHGQSSRPITWARGADALNGLRCLVRCAARRIARALLILHAQFDIIGNDMMSSGCRGRPGAGTLSRADACSLLRVPRNVLSQAGYRKVYRTAVELFCCAQTGAMQQISLVSYSLFCRACRHCCGTVTSPECRADHFHWAGRGVEHGLHSGLTLCHSLLTFWSPVQGNTFQGSRV